MKSAPATAAETLAAGPPGASSASELTGADLPDPLAKPLVVRAKTDRHAFGQLYDRTHGMVYRYCRRRFADRAAAEDICSTVFLAIAEQLPRFRGETDADFRRWALRIARNQTATARRQAGRRWWLLRSAAEAGRVPSSAATAVGASPDTEALVAAIATLGEREQTLIDLRYTEGLPHDEIARVVGMRTGAVRTAISRTLKKLRRQLEPDERG